MNARNDRRPAADGTPARRRRSTAVTPARWRSAPWSFSDARRLVWPYHRWVAVVWLVQVAAAVGTVVVAVVDGHHRWWSLCLLITAAAGLVHGAAIRRYTVVVETPTPPST